MFAPETKEFYKKAMEDGLITKAPRAKDEFDLVALRWIWVSKAGSAPEERIKKYTGIATKIANSVFYKNQSFLSECGYGREDIVSFSIVYLNVYLQLFSIQYVNDKREKFVETVLNKDPNKELTQLDIQTKDIYNMACFLRQSLGRVVSLVKGRHGNSELSSYGYQVYMALDGADIEATDSDIVLNPLRYGFVEVDKKEMKTFRSFFFNKLKGNRNIQITPGNHRFGDTTYRVISSTSHRSDKALGVRSGFYDLTVKTPEDLYIEAEEGAAFDSIFYGAPTEDKIRILRGAVAFLQENKDAGGLRYAQKMLMEQVKCLRKT